MSMNVERGEFAPYGTLFSTFSEEFTVTGTLIPNADYRFEWGDMTGVDVATADANGEYVSASHTYASAGNYTITMTNDSDESEDPRVIATVLVAVSTGDSD
jgi:PKD repeat protein